jgi:hypothetical protein
MTESIAAFQPAVVAGVEAEGVCELEFPAAVEQPAISTALAAPMLASTSSFLCLRISSSHRRLTRADELHRAIRLAVALRESQSEQGAGRAPRSYFEPTHATANSRVKNDRFTGVLTVRSIAVCPWTTMERTERFAEQRSLGPFTCRLSDFASTGVASIATQCLCDAVPEIHHSVSAGLISSVGAGLAK